MIKKILAIIPARGGSKGIKNKNIKKLHKKPLLSYTAKAALNSKYFDKIVLSTDNKKIASIGVKLGFELPFIRPKELGGDDTPMFLVIKHCLNELKKTCKYEPDIIVILQPTSPLRSSTHIDSAIEMFLNNKADSLVSISEIPHTMIPYSAMRLTPKGYLNFFLKYDEKKNLRQKKPKFYSRNGALYIFSRECFEKKKSIFGNKILPFLISKENSIDIDDNLDWFIADSLLKSKKYLI